MSAHTVEMHRPEPWAAGLFAVGLCNLLLGIGIVFKTHDLFDFGVFYGSACSWWEGTDPYLRANLNPPHASVLMAPLCALAPYPAWFAWQVLSLVAWVATLVLSWRSRPAPVTFGVIAVTVGAWLDIGAGAYGPISLGARATPDAVMARVQVRLASARGSVARSRAGHQAVSRAGSGTSPAPPAVAADVADGDHHRLLHRRARLRHARRPGVRAMGSVVRPGL